jgi:hypothetical protein
MGCPATAASSMTRCDRYECTLPQLSNALHVASRKRSAALCRMGTASGAASAVEMPRDVSSLPSAARCSTLRSSERRIAV